MASFTACLMLQSIPFGFILSLIPGLALQSFALELCL